MEDVVMILNELPVWALAEVFGNTAELVINDGKIVGILEN